MWRSMFKVIAATTAFAIVHSALASHGAKRAATKTFGERHRNGLYRVVFITQSAVTFAVLAAYMRRQPSREIYRVRPPVSLAMHGAQVTALVYATAAARQVGIRRIVGLTSFVAWLGEGPVLPEPEAQGPALDEQGLARHAGPFSWSRHPLNFAPLPILWLWPRMTTNLLAFNAAATVYLVIGSLHEESRLREVFGDKYIAYERSDVAFYLPSPDRNAADSMASVVNPQKLIK